MRIKKYIGIDCGLDGGIVQIDESGNIESVEVMPVRKIGKRRKIDLHMLDRIFLSFGQSMAGDFFVVVEDPGGHAQSAAGLRSMTYSFAAVEAMLVSHGLRYTTTPSRKWQKMFWLKPKIAKGEKFDTKTAALVAAKKLWPNQDWTKSQRATNAHDGIVDAALLAEAGRMGCL